MKNSKSKVNRVMLVLIVSTGKSIVLKINIKKTVLFMKLIVDLITGLVSF